MGHHFWDIKNADLDGEYGWDKVEPKTLLQEIIPKLQQYERSTWGEIEGGRSHFVDVDKCSSEAQKRLRKIKLDDLEELFSLRIAGKKRIWGRREGAVFHVLWWDPNHKVYPLQEKHT